MTTWRRVLNVWSLVALAALFLWMAIGDYEQTSKAAVPIFLLICSAILLGRAWHRDRTRTDSSGG
jgi:hypothetical protein